MKTLIKNVLKTPILRTAINKIPFVYNQKELEKFKQLLGIIGEAGPMEHPPVLNAFEQQVEVRNINGQPQRIKLLQFIMVSLINPPSVWDRYNKSLFKFNAEGKILVKYPFGIFFNPVSICQYALSLYDTYLKFGDESYKDLFMQQVNLLLKEGNRKDDELQFPYRYDFFDMLKGPWLSGLAQGHAVSVFLRAFILTGDHSFLDYALKSKNAINKKNGLVREVDNYYWVEEYPTANPSCALNGFVSVIISLYELSRFFPDDALLKEEITTYLQTVKKNIPDYDLGKGKIRYSKMNERLVNNNYLGLQCLQMIHLYYYSGDRFFYDRHLKWQNYFDHKEFISSYLPVNQINRRLKDISKGE